MYLLHYAPDNASMAIRLVLDKTGLPYRTALVDRRTGAPSSAAYLAVGGVLAACVSCLLRRAVLYPKDPASWFRITNDPALGDHARRVDTRPSTQRLAPGRGSWNDGFQRPRLCQPARRIGNMPPLQPKHRPIKVAP
jgi:hypothetical protein